MFSKRSDWPAGQNLLSKALEEKKKFAQEILDLTLSNPTLCGFEYLKNPAFQNLNDAKNILYEPDPHGLLAARQAITGYYAGKNIEVLPEQIFLTSSTSEAYSFLFRLLADPQDTILAPRPGYPLFDHLSQINDLTLEQYPLSYEASWRLQEEALKPFLKSSPKALIWVNPNNPTGNYACPAEIKMLNQFSARHSCPLIADEVFLDFSWNGDEARQSFAGNHQTLTFTLSGISKILGLPQMKLSWIVVSGPRNQRGEAIRRLEIISDAYLSVNSLVQHALASWLDGRQAVISEILSRVGANRAKLVELAQMDSNISVLNAQGGWYAVLRLDGISDELFCLDLLTEKNLLVHPGYLFDFWEENYLVISLLLPQERFAAGIEKLIIWSRNGEKSKINGTGAS